ncbi:MAG: hypothetical protein RR086_00540 [Clostridia bacterium]
MFNGLFGNEQEGMEHGGFGCGCNCTWIILVVLLLCCCCGKMKKFSLSIEPCCLLLVGALLLCTGGLKIGKDCH